MAKFLVKASYTAEGAKGVAFGDTDAYVVLDLPDNQTAVAASIAVNTSGGASSEVVVLLTPEDVDAAARLSVDYRPPGS